MVHPSIMFRNLPEIRYREKFRGVQDYDLYLRMKGQGMVIANLPLHLVKYRLDEKHTDITKVLKHMSYQFLAIDLHRERVEAGKDSYEDFDPEKYENLTIESVKDERVVKEVVAALYRGGDIKQARSAAHAYFKKFGFDLTVTQNFLFTFLPIPLRNLLRSLSNYFYSK
jgi:hypothetical protein